MDTKPLERFATWARRELLSVVDAQASTVLAAASVARTERADTVRRLEDEIELHGRQYVVDKIAYTWFNRIISLRFMDARGYTDAGIVSPAQGQVDGQPEMLADAKSGNLDPKVVTSTRTADAIIGLLDGTRRSANAEGEAYALLLTEYCRYWHQAMPFMFEREGDYTELLVPANLLADGAILSRARQALTTHVCRDVEVIGWLYQFYIAERKNEVFTGFKNKNKAGADELPAATQLFTPHWIVRYMVENSLGRLWVLNRPNSRIVEQMDYYIAPVDKQTEFLEITGPEQLSVIDPACGSGHMLTYAFDLLYAMYEEEGYAPADIPGLILTHNLHGAEIDPRAGALAAFALTMKARSRHRAFFRKQVAPKVRVIEPISFTPDEINVLVAAHDDEEEVFWNQFRSADTLGSLIQPSPDSVRRATAHLDSLVGENDLVRDSILERAHQVVAQASILSQEYSTVVANPPYMGGKNMNSELAEFAKHNFPNSKSDLFSMFIERCIKLSRENGVTAMITMHSWMFISSFERLRQSILETAPIVSMLHLGERAFDSIGGAVVSTTAFILERRGEHTRQATYVRVVDGQNEAEKRETLLAAARGESSFMWHVAPSELAMVPGAPISYWLSNTLRSAFTIGKPLREIGAPKAGMHGGDINRFARLWHEVAQGSSYYEASSTSELHDDGSKWVGLNKGGSFRKWYGNQEYVISFDRETYKILADCGNKLPSRDYYFLPSVSWSKVSSGSPTFRYYPQGFVFDVAGTPVFSSYRDHINLLSVANSEIARILLTAVAPTLNFEIGQIASLPIPNLATENDANRVEEMVTASKTDWDSFETSWEFSSNGIVTTHKLTQGDLKQAVDRFLSTWEQASKDQQGRETKNNEAVAQLFGVDSEVSCEVPIERVSLTRNSAFRWPDRTPESRRTLALEEAVKELVSYAVGCAFGRYSLDEPGLILADQGSSMEDYFTKVPDPTYMPDADNVIPFVDDGRFERDIVERFREFLRTAFGRAHFEQNLRFVEDSLGVKEIRDYFITTTGKSRFYDDHVQRYKRRPIYWMFSSSKGSFNAMVYMHRYTPSTGSTVLNEYLREYRAKLEVALTNAEQAAAGGSAQDRKQADRLRKVLVELAEYEHDVIYPLATRQLPIDLDDGVLVNYLRLGRALRDIGLEKDRSKVKTWDWPHYQLEVSQ